MTRALSELLGAPEPAFRSGLRRLERASGDPSEDIRLSTEVLHKLQAALKDLGLDPLDTSGHELYYVLQEHVKKDDEVIRELLQVDSNTENLMVRLQRFVASLDVPKRTFALRLSVAKRLLKKNPPKKAMKRLGYRSIDSMLKHEPVPQVYAAAVIAESLQWHKNFLAQYKHLLPSDFEVREVMLCAPDNKRWDTLGAVYVPKVKHNIMTFNELGSVVMLPLSAGSVDGAALATLVLTIHAINDIRCTSTYLKLHQVRPDFGELLSRVARSEPYTEADLVGERLPWKVVQHYFARTPEEYQAEIFEPHVQPEDLVTRSAESVLSSLHPRLSFWKGKQHTGLLDNGSPVSLNLTDSVLNFCNHLPYEQRIVKYFREHLLRELMLRYMHQDNIEQTVRDQLSSEMVDDLSST